MFERFTDRARRVVVLAQEEARMLNHNYIGTEHISSSASSTKVKALQQRASNHSASHLKAFAHKLKKLSDKVSRRQAATFHLLHVQRKFSNSHFVKRYNLATTTLAQNIFCSDSFAKAKALQHRYS
jgi:ATP-dependent Clp protease ATP-binding subunit ClpA